jgi:hypothetical protein
MYLLLLVFGAVLTAAGIVLAASGISIHDRAFDATVVTPGTVAAVGGLVLFGLGLALRILQRIEQSLAARPMPRVLRPGEATEAAAATELRGGAAQIPVSSKITPRVAVLSHGPSVATATPLAATHEKQLGDLTEKLPENTPAMARFENARVVEETELSLSPSAVPRVDVAVGEIVARTARRINGAAPTRIMPRLDLGARSPSARPSITTERPKGPAFDSLWPKGPRPMRTAQSVSLKPLPEPPATAPMTEPEQISGPANTPAAASQDEAPSPVSVLKSGVVDGMAYTLFSDGSIKAELPQGTLRFGSITELRNHIEQNS